MKVILKIVATSINYSKNLAEKCLKVPKRIEICNIIQKVATNYSIDLCEFE